MEDHKNKGGCLNYGKKKSDKKTSQEASKTSKEEKGFKEETLS